MCITHPENVNSHINVKCYTLMIHIFCRYVKCITFLIIKYNIYVNIYVIHLLQNVSNISEVTNVTHKYRNVNINVTHKYKNVNIIIEKCIRILKIINVNIKCIHKC